MPFKRKRFIFWYCAETHEQRLQEACTRSRADRPARKSPGTPEIAYFRESRDFSGAGGRRLGAKRLLEQACCNGCLYISTQNQKIKRPIWYTCRLASLRSRALLKVLLPFRKDIWNRFVLQMSSTFGTVLYSKWVSHLEHGGATCGDGWRWRKNRVTDAICLVKASLVASRG